MLDRKAAPPFVQARDFSLPGFSAIDLRGGARLFMMRGVQQEVIKVEMLFHAGRWFEQTPGISHFTAHMLEKGTRSRGSAELAEAFDSLGAHVEISTGYDHASISVYALKKNWQEAVRLMTEMILEPSFDREELNLMKSIFVQNLRVNLEKNSFVAGQLIRRNIFGARHPYGSILEEQEVLGIEEGQLTEFHSGRFNPFAIFVTAHSSIAESEIESMVNVFPGALAIAANDHPVIPGTATESKEKPGSIQTSLRLGKRTVLRSDPRYFDVALFNHILGGYFGSRLMKNIREEKGLTYGIYSSLSPFRKDGFLVIGADVNKENVALALKEIAREIRKLIESPIDLDELEIARSHLLGSIQLEVANPFSATDKIKNIHVNGLPEDYYQRLFDRVGGIGVPELMKTGRELFAVEDLFTVTVG